MKSLLAALALCLPAVLAAQGSPSSHKTDCTAPEGWADVLARDPDFVVFGEWHGTNEGPDLVASLLCAEASHGERVLLAVEHSSSRNAEWRAAWALSHEGFREVLPNLGWRNREDGVASVAMLRLVLTAHALKAQGAAVDIVAFNGARDDAQRARFAHLPGQGPHEAAQAENIAEAAALKAYKLVIVLVGSLHAEIAPVPLSSAGATFPPMARQLADFGSVISLNTQHAGGTAWSCRLPPGFKRTPGQEITNDMIRCAAYEDRGTATHDRLPFIDISQAAAKAAAGRYHGVFWAGPVSASPPASPPEK